jgi:hypothetical protein
MFRDFVILIRPLPSLRSYRQGNDPLDQPILPGKRFPKFYDLCVFGMISQIKGSFQQCGEKVLLAALRAAPAPSKDPPLRNGNRQSTSRALSLYD